jgi:hypothetical protein
MQNGKVQGWHDLTSNKFRTYKQHLTAPVTEQEEQHVC